ncbi:WxL domain-containing protein [Enterococcus quebecensis]|uniref:WxL domain-containing protein n=1 Tax=Enterococcus quebecensis TaxID=903983 RepID=A0A1E5GRK6_9ENTE|nr:WxL domain-containing protein [Enterococcus quebecensis]OEG15195.1 hypothetical protein BCR23_10180 [Enterococcus quebecensis]OJG74773.1 hypothetical protein RV12_GL002190 [Enterococcus quebecensis]
MKKIHLFSMGLLLVIALTTVPSSYYAQENSNSGDMNITLDTVDPKLGVMDPEKKNEKLAVEEGTYGKTSGPLRIDFVPNLGFSSNKISANDISYSADALLFKGQIAPRGSFIQVSDYRGNANGWTLQVRQETQFKNQNKENSQLNGAVISLDKSWINTSNGFGQTPNISKEVIHLNNIGETYTLAEAKKGTGAGTWSIVFGASPDNQVNQNPTMTPRLDKEGKPVINPSLDNQAVYMNDAVSLTIPGATKKDSGTYSTVLTWIISELP